MQCVKVLLFEYNLYNALSKQKADIVLQIHNVLYDTLTFF